MLSLCRHCKKHWLCCHHEYKYFTFFTKIPLKVILLLCLQATNIREILYKSGYQGYCFANLLFLIEIKKNYISTSSDDLRAMMISMVCRDSQSDIQYIVYIC